MSDPIPSITHRSFWDDSPLLREILKRRLAEAAAGWSRPLLERLGEQAAAEVPELAWIADRQSPRLVTHSPQGRRIDRVDYHPAYRRMEEIAYGSGMIGMKYDPAILAAHGAEAAQLVSFALGYLFAMAEASLFCPACMTDGVARVLTLHGSDDQRARVLPRVTARRRPELWTGAMFLTEKSGGSDVGQNETTVTRDGERLVARGQKWFCSNVDAEAVLLTARPEGAVPGTKGLRTYLMLREGNQGIFIDRLKEKLGVRSMPTGEVTLDGAVVEEVGGFEAITGMLNLSRLYNAVASVAVIGRAILEARRYAGQRIAFGKPVLEHPLARETMLDLEAEHAAALLMTFDAVAALGRADEGDAEAAKLIRVLTPVVKAVTAKLAVPAVSEAMEMIGGNAYIEESPLPRLLRDAQVLPIWEGTTNVLVLDAMRAIRKESAHEAMLEKIRRHFAGEADELAARLPSLEESQLRRWVDRLARLYGLALLVEQGLESEARRLRNRPLGLVPGARVW